VASGSRNWWQENLRLVSVPPHALMRAAKILTMSQPRRSSIHPTLPYFTLGWSATLAFAPARRTQAKADASQGKTSPTQVTPRRDCGAGFSNFSTSSHPIHICYLNSDSSPCAVTAASPHVAPLSPFRPHITASLLGMSTAPSWNLMSWNAGSAFITAGPARQSHR
jgi:hypothetical protein